MNYRAEEGANKNAGATSGADWLAIGAIAADVLVTIIVIVGMAVDRHSVTVSVLSGVAFFVLFGSLVILTLSGSLTAMVVNGQNQKTTRQQHQLQYSAQIQAQQWTVAERPRLERRPSTDTMQLPESPRFVPAVAPVEENLRFMAATFVNDLFDLQTGTFNKRVSPNTRQIQRKAPNKEVEKYLEELGITYRGKGGQWYWNIDHYPVRIEAIRAINNGRPVSLEDRVGSEGKGGLLVGESAA